MNEANSEWQTWFQNPSDVTTEWLLCTHHRKLRGADRPADEGPGQAPLGHSFWAFSIWLEKSKEKKPDQSHNDAQKKI